MIKLKPLLFEGVSREEFEKTFYDTMKGNNPLIGEIPDVEEFYELNKQVLDRILKGATEFRFLGAGSYGSAYSIGNKQVLKIEPSSHRAETIASRFDKKMKTGLHHPMIYDTGKLKTEDGELSFAILEKMEIPSDEELVAIEQIIEPIHYIMNSVKRVQQPDGKFKRTPYSPKDVVKELMLRKADKIKEIGEKLRLKDDWFEKLVNHMFKVRKEGLSDFHSGNIGIRRIGPEGYLEFFD
jgi:hypothetical protein